MFQLHQMPVFACRAVFFCSAEAPDRIIEGARAGADMIIVDLEDEVVPANKVAAREGLAKLIADCPAGPSLFVRVNSPKSAWFADDLTHVAALEGLAGVLVPKVEGGADLLAAHVLLSRAGAADLPLIAVLESPAAFLNIQEIARADVPLVGFTLGPFDLTRALGAARRDDAEPVLGARTLALMAGRARGIAIIDGPADARLGTAEKDMAFAAARALGFDGKIITRVEEIARVRTLFTPGAEMVTLAEQIVAAFVARPDDEIVTLETGATVDRGNFSWARRTLNQTHG